MGMFDVFKKKEAKGVGKLELFAPIKGNYIPLHEIQDAVFSQGILGEGCGMIPAEGKVYAPLDGEISLIAETKHAIGIRTENGVEILIHVGMDTVEMNGDGFDVKTSIGRKVKKGELLLSFDIEKIKMAGYSTDTAFVIVEMGAFCNLNINTNKEYERSEYIGQLDN